MRGRPGERVGWLGPESAADAYRAAMRRRVLLVFMAVWLGACSANSACTTKPCKTGLSVLLKDYAATLAAGTKTSLQLCLDGDCRTLAVDRTPAHATQFVELTKLDKVTDVVLTLSGGPDGAVKSEYRGRVGTVLDQPNGPKCPARCQVGTVRVDAKGGLQVATPVVAVATTTSAKS